MAKVTRKVEKVEKVTVVEEVRIVLDLSEEEALRLTALLGAFGSESPMSFVKGPNLFNRLHDVMFPHDFSRQHCEYEQFRNEAKDAIRTRAKLIR